MSVKCVISAMRDVLMCLESNTIIFSMGSAPVTYVPDCSMDYTARQTESHRQPTELHYSNKHQ